MTDPTHPASAPQPQTDEQPDEFGLACDGAPFLKRCPFCNGHAHFMDVLDDNPNPEHHGGIYVECADCNITTPLGFSLMEDCRPMLAEKWNARVAARKGGS